MRRVISVSVFGDDQRYIVGAHRQYLLAKYWYPGWEFRLYIDNADKVNMPDATIVEVKEGGNGMFWRFFPFFEEGITIVRDADSRITAREVMAVHEWISSGKKFHIMKDHAFHRQAMNSGMIGMRGQLDDGLQQSILEAMRTSHGYGKDEEFLERVVHPTVGDDRFEHSMARGWFGESRKHLLNPYEFVGNGYDENDFPIYSYEDMSLERSNLTEACRFASYPRKFAKMAGKC